MCSFSCLSRYRYFILFPCPVFWGHYKINGEFVVLQGSRATKEEARAISQAYVTLRKQLQMEGKLKDDGLGQFLVFAEDVPFSSVSTAASVVRGMQSSGRTAWKVKGSKLRKLLLTLGNNFL